MEHKPFLTYSLERLSSAAIKAADVHYLDACDLKVRELRVLRLIQSCPGCTPTELLGGLELDKTLLSKYLAALEQKGLILRRVDERDNRRQCLFLSEQGDQVWAAAEQLGRGLEAEMFGGLSAEEWEHLHSLLEKARLSLQDWQGQMKR